MTRDAPPVGCRLQRRRLDRKSTRLNSSHSQISYAVFCLKKKKNSLNFHALHFMRTLPIGSADPNLGSRVRNRHQLHSTPYTWPYVYSIATADVDTHEAF